ncbi:MAG: PucR family transcriptional regulator [Advenella sp.]
MSLRIADIINLPELRTRFFAGSQGSDNTVSWAHVCELPDPTEWLGEGHLLMTTGIGIPKDPAVQAAYIEKLARAGLAGMMIGENMQAPEDLSVLQETAEKLGFPILMTQYGVPFSSVIRAVFDAERKQEFERRNAINRIFVSARMAIEGLSLEQLVVRLEKDIHAELMLLDLQDKTRFWYPRNKTLPASLQEAIQQQPLEFSEISPVIRRYAQDDGETVAISVPSRREGVLFIRGAEDYLLDYSFLHQLVAVLGIAIERRFVEVERSLRIGSQLLDDMLGQRLSHYDMGEKLEQFNLRIESACLAVARPDEHRLVEWNLQLLRHGLPAILRPQGDDLIVLLQTKDLPAVQAILKTGLGVSSEIGNYGRLTEALREANLARYHTNQHAMIVSYAQIVNRVPWIPSSLDEAAQAFQRVLGELIEYDVRQGTNLLHTLTVFLEKNRSWLTAAKSLHIHKTTLIYRIQKVESLTGLSMDSTEDVAVLWFALKAGEITGFINNNKNA